MKKILSIEYFIALLLTITVIGLIFPYGFPLFSIVVMIYFIYYLMNESLYLKFNFSILLIFISIFLYVLAIFLTFDKIYPHNQSDLVNIAVLLLILLIIGKANDIQYNNAFTIFSKLSLAIVPILAAFSLYKFLLLNNGVYIEFIKIADRSYPGGTSLMPDYNMFAIGMISGLIGILFIFKKTKSFYIELYCYISIILIVASVILAGSRRGWIILPLIIIYAFYLIYKKNTFPKVNLKSTLNLIVFTISLFAVIYISADIITGTEAERLLNRYSTLSNIEESSESRTIRWDYSLDIIKQYDLFEVVFGRGFSYLPTLGERLNTISGYDYPHNLFISTFLYSGILGLTFFTLLVLLPIVKYLLNRKYIRVEFIVLYGLTLLFLMISGNSMFSNNLFWLLLVLLSNIGSEKGIVNEKSSITSI